MTLPKIPIYSGDVPQRTQAPEVFSANADSCLAYQLPLANSFNALAEYLNKYNYADGGFFTPAASQQYPIITEMDLNIYYAITFPNPNDTYTYTSGNLNGVTVQSGTVIRFDNETSTWSYAQPYGGGVSQASFISESGRVDSLLSKMAARDAGSEKRFPPNWTADTIAFTPKDGGLLNREDQPVLWAAVQASGNLITEAEWQSTKSNPDNVNEAVSAYSDGDGSTTFRKPSVGTHGAFGRAVGSDDAAVADLLYATQDEMRNHGHVTPLLLVGGDTATTGKVGNNGAEFWGTTPVEYSEGADPYQTVPGLSPSSDASPQDLANTSDFMVSIDQGGESKPISTWESVWICTGKIEATV